MHSTVFLKNLELAAGKRTLTLSDRPELRIDPAVLLNTGAIANVSNAEVYSLAGH